MLTPSLTERLKALADNAERLPPDAQDKLAEQIANVLDNALWDAQLRDPDQLAVLRALAEEARRAPKLPMPIPEDTGDADLVDTGEDEARASGETSA